MNAGRWFLAAMIAALPAFAAEIPDPTAKDLGDWELRCGDNGCTMLRSIVSKTRDGEPVESAVMFAIERATKKAAFVTIDMPADADEKYGVEVAFSSAGSFGNTFPDAATKTVIPFEKCDEISCVARISHGLAEGHDLVQDFTHYRFVFFSYRKGGQSRTITDDLSLYQRDYARVMAALSKPQ